MCSGLAGNKNSGKKMTESDTTQARQIINTEQRSAAVWKLKCNLHYKKKGRCFQHIIFVFKGGRWYEPCLEYHDDMDSGLTGLDSRLAGVLKGYLCNSPILDGKRKVQET